MSDEEVIKQICKSKADQALREHLFKGESLETAPKELSESVESYLNMSESEKQQYTQKEWKNG